MALRLVDCISLGWTLWWRRRHEANPRIHRLAAASWLASALALLALLSMPLALMATLTYPFDDRTWWPAGWGLPLAAALLATWILGGIAFWPLALRKASD